MQLLDKSYGTNTEVNDQEEDDANSKGSSSECSIDGQFNANKSDCISHYFLLGLNLQNADYYNYCN